jgi:hypothetical protein
LVDQLKMFPVELWVWLVVEHLLCTKWETLGSRPIMTSQTNKTCFSDRIFQIISLLTAWEFLFCSFCFLSWALHQQRLYLPFAKWSEDYHERGFYKTVSWELIYWHWHDNIWNLKMICESIPLKCSHSQMWQNMPVISALGRIMSSEIVWSGYNISIHGNVKIKTPVYLLYTNKMLL